MRIPFKLTRSRKIMLGFMLIILIGTVLLMLPFATRNGQHTTLSRAMLTSVSATCVTGLVAYDTWSHWTLFGQLVILTEIQIGGLGFITIGTFLMILMHKKIGIARRALVNDSLSTLQMRGSVRLVARVIRGTLLIEGCGALLLSIRFIPQLGFLRGLYYGIFHSVSAFCNAGFDLIGFQGAYSSFCPYYNDPVVILTLSALIIIGGLGFIVWDDILEHHFQWKHYGLHTKLVLSGTAFLLLASTVLFLLFERNALFSDMPAGDKFLAAFFSAVTPRTAGFNSIDTASLSDGSLFLTIILMFIGGSPGSTAGGIKTVTLFVVLLYLGAYLLREKDSALFRKRIDEESLRKANIVISFNLLLALIGVLAILAAQPLPLRDVLFEVFSAIGTAGMSTGVTRQLNLFSRCVIMLLMFLGRMGSLTFAMSFTEERKVRKIRYPKEDVIIG